MPEGRETANAGPREDIRLQLLCIRVNPALAILNVMPHLGPQQLGPQHRALLQNMLRTCGIAPGEMQEDDKPFRWPLVQGGHMDNGRVAAATAVTAFLQQKHADWGFSRLLVLGETTISELFKPADRDAEPGPDLDKQPWQSLYARSLDEYLQQPALKRDLWQALARFRA